MSTISPHDGRTVVVINDDPVQLRILARTLREGGYNVLPCSSASDAFKRMGLSGVPSLIITDLYMPDIDGWRICRLLRSDEFPEYNRVPILVMSATFSGVDAHYITRQLGADAFLDAPLRPDEILRTVSDVLSGKGHTAHREAVVVDDDITTRRLLRTAFESAGMTVMEAGTVEEARALASTPVPFVVVLDYHLPDGDNADLLKELRSRWPATVILMVTTDPDPTLAVEWMRCGADGYVRKPFDTAYIFELLEIAARQRAMLAVEALLEERSRQLRASEEKYRWLFHDAPEMMALIDDDGRLIDANRTLLGTLGYTREEALGSHCRDLTLSHDEAPPDAPAPWGWDAEELNGVLCNLRHRDGSAVHVRMSSRHLRDPSGSMVRIAIARDVTRESQLQQQLRLSQRLEAIGTVARGIAHEITNPVNGILNYAQLILDRTENDENTCAYASEIIDESRRVTAVAHNLLSFSSREVERYDAVCLRDLMNDVMNLLRQRLRAEDVDIHVEVPDDLPGLPCRPMQIRQVLFNLILNGIDAVSERDPADAGERLVTLRARQLTGTEEKRIRIEVEDTGVGIAEGLREQIFHPFFTTRSRTQNTGLGLSISHNIAEEHGGRLFLESAAQGATRFVLEMPTGEENSASLSSPHKTDTL